jgi:hypothetical protein
VVKRLIARRMTAKGDEHQTGVIGWATRFKQVRGGRRLSARRGA